VLLIGRWSVEREDVRSERPIVIRSVMVLPFVDEAGPVGSRLAFQVESLLAWMPATRVVPAATAPRRPHTLSDLREIATLVGASTILHGEVDTLGTKLHVRLRLGVMPDDFSMWSADVVIDSSEVPELARSIADSVGSTLHGVRTNRLAKVHEGLWKHRSSDGRVARSLELEKSGDIVEALREARRAHELHPLDRDIHVNLIQMLRRAGRDAEATRDSALLERMTRYLGGQIVRGGRR
jgi:TolB-like protein